MKKTSKKRKTKKISQYIVEVINDFFWSLSTICILMMWLDGNFNGFVSDYLNFYWLIYILAMAGILRLLLGNTQQQIKSSIGRGDYLFLFGASAIGATMVIAKSNFGDFMKYIVSSIVFLFICFISASLIYEAAEDIREDCAA